MSKLSGVYKVYKYQNISTTVVYCCIVCGTVFCFSPATYRVQCTRYNIVIYVVFQNIVLIAVLTVDLFSPSLLSVHVCKGLEFRVRFEASYGKDHGKKKLLHH